jgi:diguanylate cyclase (GGDEF)-like protein
MRMMNNTGQYRAPGLLGKLGAMTSIRDTELVEQSLLRTLGPLLGVLDTSLYRLDDEQLLARVIHYHRSKEVDAQGVGRMVERIEEIVRPDDMCAEIAALTDNIRLLGKPCTRAIDGEMLIGYPLVGSDEMCGYFVFRRDREVAPNEDATIRGVLEVFSNYYALLDMSQRDRLTGLLNRQALEGNFERIWSVMARPDNANEKVSGRRTAHLGKYWLAFIDIDYFKQVNDRFGHMVGDEILLLVARLMQNTFRATDLLYRYGGEEFVAIISAENDLIARNVFERVRLAIEAHVFPRVEKLTVSIGYAEVDPNVLPVEVLSRADRSLYQAKQDGRNLVYDFHELVERGIFQNTNYGDAELF